MGRFSRRRLAIAAILIVALAWSVGSSLSIYPHSLSYFNELAAVLPTPADTSYPTPNCGDETNRGIFMDQGCPDCRSAKRSSPLIG